MNGFVDFFDRQRQNIESRKAGLCGCWACTEERGEVRAFMIVCPDCGYKRCPKASDHRLACTGSNEEGQPGSIYTALPPLPTTGD